MADKAFRLDSLATLWDEFEDRHTRMANDKKWCDEFKGTLKKLAGSAEEFKLRNQKVAMLVPGQLNKSLLRKEQPAIVAEYTVMVTEAKFDQTAFALEMPGMFAQYQVQRLVLASEKPSEQDTE